MQGMEKIDQIVGYFKQISDLNVEWVIENNNHISSKPLNSPSHSTNDFTQSQVKPLQVTFKMNTNGDILDVSNHNSMNSGQQLPYWEPLDDITCMTLELGMHLYYKSNFNQENRYIEINSSYRIDLKESV